MLQCSDELSPEEDMLSQKTWTFYTEDTETKELKPIHGIKKMQFFKDRTYQITSQPGITAHIEKGTFKASGKRLVLRHNNKKQKFEIVSMSYIELKLRKDGEKLLQRFRAIN